MLALHDSSIFNINADTARIRKDTITLAQMRIALGSGEYVSIVKHGGVGDDDPANAERNKIALGLAQVEAASKGVPLYIPSGRYYIDLTSANNLLTSDLVVMGDGHAKSVFIRDETVDVVNAGMFYRFNTDPPANLSLLDHFELRDIGFEGQWADVDDTQSTTYMVMQRFKNVKITGCRFEDICYLNTAVGFCENVQIRNNIFKDISRDGIRVNSCEKVSITGNQFENVNDDAIAVLTSDDVDSQSNSIVINGNTFKNSFGIFCRGGHNITIVGNVMERPKLRCISVVMAEEGDATGNGRHIPHSINISGNIIVDPQMRIWSADDGTTLEFQTKTINPDLTTRVIEVIGPSVLPGGTFLDETAINGADNTNRIRRPYGNYKQSDAYTDNTVINAATGIVISNNIVMRTHDLSGNYSDWGFGNPTSKWREAPDQAISHDIMRVAGVELGGYLGEVTINNNQFTGLEWGIHHYAEDDSLEIRKLIVNGNVFKDIRRCAISTDFRASQATEGAILHELECHNNVFDMDPYYLYDDVTHANRRDEGSWNVSAAEADDWNFRTALRFEKVCDFVSIQGNTFKNTGVMVCEDMENFTTSPPTAPNNMVFTNNRVWYGLNTVSGGVGVQDSREGVSQVLSSRHTNAYVYYDSDVDSANFGEVQADTIYAGALPTADFYMEGHFVSSGNPDITNGLGWMRLTTGSDHVVGTDWVELGVYSAPVASSWDTENIKAADEEITSNTTLAVDTDFTIALDASSVYEVEFYGTFDTNKNSSTPGVQYRIDYTGTIDATNGLDLTTVETGGSWDALELGATRSVFVTDQQRDTVNISGLLETNSAGDLTFEWAQNTTDPLATNLYRGALMRVRKLL